MNYKDYLTEDKKQEKERYMKQYNSIQKKIKHLQGMLKQHMKMQKKVYSEYEFYGGLDQVESSLDKINRAFRFN